MSIKQILRKEDNVLNLFNPQKDLIWRIVNAVLLVWALISIVVFLNFTIVENLIPDASLRNYNNYKVNRCAYMAEEKNVVMPTCREQYNSEKDNIKYNNYRGTLGSVISFAISAGALWYLNLNRKTKKAK